MKLTICSLLLLMIGILDSSCTSGNIVGIWESMPDENGKFKRYHFTEQKEFQIESCRLKKGEVKPKTIEDEKLWRLVLIYLFQKMTGRKFLDTQPGETDKAEEEKERCVETTKGEYKITIHCESLVNCLLKPQYKLTLKAKGGLAGVFAKLVGDKEIEFVRKGRELILGEEKLVKVKGKNFDWRDYF